MFRESNTQELLDPLPKKRCVSDIGARAYAITTDARDRQKSIQNLFSRLPFPRIKEALHAGVIVATAGTAHTPRDLMAPKRFAKQLAGELAAPIRVKDHAFWFGLPILRCLEHSGILN